MQLTHAYSDVLKSPLHRFTTSENTCVHSASAASLTAFYWFLDVCVTKLKAPLLGDVQLEFDSGQEDHEVISDDAVGSI